MVLILEWRSCLAAGASNTGIKPPGWREGDPLPAPVVAVGATRQGGSSPRRGTERERDRAATESSREGERGAARGSSQRGESRGGDLRHNLDRKRTDLPPVSSVPSHTVDHRRGHDYKRVDDGKHRVDEARVHGMLKERLQAKMARDFAAANRIQDKLTAIGVEVNDKQGSWGARVLKTTGGGKGSCYYL